MTPTEWTSLALKPMALGLAAGAVLAAALGWSPGRAGVGQVDPLWQAAQAFRRPVGVPVPAADPPNAARVALGEALFNDRRLSRDGSLSCASCHDPALSYADGAPRSRGIAGTPLPRHTPHLWNLAWSETLFWDGRASSLEQQAAGPIGAPAEMGQDLAEATRVLAADAPTAARFAAAFPGEEGPTAEQVLRALAAFERTLVSPDTRFDRWVAGDATALDGQERQGFAVFVGKAGCAACHSGWAFSDRAFHDIGLPGEDPGRAAVIGLRAAAHAFRTPSLRELSWTAPYMHDGSLPSLEAVLDHYGDGIVARPSLSPDLKPVRLAPDEREALLAFLQTLSSESPPTPSPLRGIAVATTQEDPVRLRGAVRQVDKTFSPARVALAAGASLSVVNDDTRTHNVRLDGGDWSFDSGAQEPGQTASITFARPGHYRIYCGIHPAMQLSVTVTAAP